MTDEAGVATLTSAQVLGLIKVLPEICVGWARIAGTDPALLSQGHSRALTAVRAASGHDRGALLGELARIGLPRIFAMLDASETDGDEEITDFAAAAGRVLGADGSAVFLGAVAVGGDSFAVEVAGRLAELRDIAARHADRGSPLTTLIARTGELIARGTALAELIAKAAANVAAGSPATMAGRELTEWSMAVEQHLADAERVVVATDLRTLGSGLAAAARAAQEPEATEAERGRAVQDALRAARLLHEQGLDALIPAMLQGVGLDTMVDWRALLDLEAAGQVVAGQQAGVAEPAIEPEPELLAEPELLPEQEMLPEQETVAEAEPAPAAEPEPDTEAEVGPTLDDVQFPWDGSPSLIASLLVTGQDALAVCIAAAASEPATRQRLLRFFCAAFCCSPAALELRLPQLSLPDAEVKGLTIDESRLLLATVLRVGLSVGYSPVDLPSLIDRAELEPPQEQVVLAAADVIRHDYRRDTGAAVMKRADLIVSWAAFGDRARALREAQSRGKLPLQRASNVLRHIAAPDQPVGRALTVITELSELGITAANTEAQAEKWAHLESVGLQLSTAGGRNRLIASVDEAVSRGTQLRKRIVGVAMAKLDGALQEAARLISDFLATRTAIRQVSVEADLRGAESLPRALSELAAAGEPAPQAAGDAALRRLTDWLRAGAQPAAGASLAELLDAALTPLYELPRDAAGSPDRIPTAAEARELLHGRDQRCVVRGYLGKGNIAAARALVAAADEADQAELDDAVQVGLQAARRRHNEALASVYSIAGRLRAMYDDASARELTVTAETEPAPEDGRFDIATGKLLDAVADGEQRLCEYRGELRVRAQQCGCDEADRQRILSLIDHQDEVLAVEFLTMAEAGQPLPEAEPEGSDDFAAFFPAMVEVAMAATRDRMDAVAAVRAAVGAVDGPANRQLADGLNAWGELKSGKRGSQGDSFRKLVADVLRMIGLMPRDQNWLQEISRTQRSGYATFRVRATPIDRSYVPSLGTQASSDYDLTLVWDDVTSTRLLDFIDEKRRTRANIIVYFNTLDCGQRLQLRRSTRNNGGKGFSPVVIDDAVAGWLTTLAEPGWRFTQTVTLPFTTMNPYSPFAGGEVPEEVFVGREQERAEIESPTGSMFVYGGRQLGKSALLRRVERMFTDAMPAPSEPDWQARSGRVAVYLDLKAASIGDAREPSALWPVLAERLVAARVLDKDASLTAQPERISRLISDWLQADDGNRLLLLLDEADNFLTKDSRARKSGSGTEFPNLQRLKELMETSDRRFKAVFAGLHQVQRFHDSSNTPVAHGGNDILVGQLSTMAAYRLAVDPMTALGYVFASPEHVWRLLLFANYQASLVQIVCEALVREMARKELPAGGGRIVIDAADVEAVIAKRAVIDLIVQRFWWTINVDPRYRVIALVVAERSLDVEPGHAFSPEDLHEFCELYWDAGFSRAQLSGKEFRRYLEEMVGLGVLYRQDGEFGLRSPNILSLLGTRQSIDQALTDAPWELEVRDEYNPSTNRRIIGNSAELSAPRSPLTDRDIAGLLGLDGQRHGRVQVVTGSSALAIARAASVIRDVADMQQIRCEIRRVDELATLPRRRSHLVVDLSASAGAAAEIASAYARLGELELAEIRATIIVGPECVPVRLDGIDQADVTSVKRWSAEGLRSWHDTPFTTPGMRARLYRVTSGWPLLVEETMREITAGKSPDQALDLILERLADPIVAGGHLADCGIDLSIAIPWAAKFGVDGDDGLPEAFPATIDELTAELGVDMVPVVERLQVLDAVEDTPNGWVLDRAVFAAAAALGGPGAAGGLGR
jgi:hypothetical protein